MVAFNAGPTLAVAMVVWLVWRTLVWGPLGLAGRLLTLVGLLVWAGHLFIGGVARRTGHIRPSLLTLLGRVGPVLVLVGTAAAVVSSALVATGSVAAVGQVFASQSGRWQALLLGGAAVGALTRPRPLRDGVLVPIVVLAEAASGHAAASATPIIAMVAAALHIGAAGVWTYALVVALGAGRKLPTVLAALWRYAVAAAVVVAVTGGINAWLSVHDFRALVTSGYGRLVLGKTAALIVMAALGVVQHRRRNRQEPLLSELATPTRAELISAGLAILLAVGLVGFPNTPRDDAAALDVAGGGLLTAGISDTEAVSVATASGPFLVALSILPPRPGPVEMRVVVDGLEPSDALRNARVRATSATGVRLEIALAPCGLGCFSAMADIPVAGDWTFATSLESARGPLRLHQTLPLPTPSGDAVLARALEAMQSLGSVRVNEALRATQDSAPIQSEYDFVAPDAMRFTVEGSNGFVVIGDQRFQRLSVAQPWTRRTWDPPFSWPIGFYAEYWDQDTAALRVIGQESIDGVPSMVLSFVRTDVNAWFRLWVGIDDGRVRQMQMATRGHFMEQRFVDFNAPYVVEAPV